jgi:endonuclease/exonuclease/phosphatase family metal-dependent hydrolase
MKVLSWNLFHGRAEPPAGRELLGEFAGAIAGWEWDVALLQEVPPWWPVPLAEHAGASMRMRLTSRNEPYLPRMALARRWPDLVRSGGGGCNAILVRGQAIAEHRAQRLTWRPERRVVHGVRLADGTWAANLHASKQEPRARTERDVRRAGAAVAGWAHAAPRVVLGGDFNLPAPETVLDGLDRVAGGGVDYVLARGLRRVAARALEAGPLSDHRPIVVELEAL